MKKWLLPLILLSNLAYADVYMALGASAREKSYNVSVGWHPLETESAKIGAEVEFASMGKQPSGYNNINRMVSVSAVAHVHLIGDVYGFGKFGINNTKYSYNGTNNYDRSNDSLWGTVTAVGVEYKYTDNLYFQVHGDTHRYRQVNNPNIGGFTYIGAGIRYIIWE